MSDENIIIELEEEPIELCKLLKVLDLVEGGGQAKMLIADGYIGLNNETCLQKRKKIYGGDLLHFDGETFEITLAEGVTPAERPVQNLAYQAKPEPVKATTKSPQNKKKSAQQSNKQAKAAKPKKPANGTGRKPISFG